MPLITLLTDYGLDDEFVGVCHGVIAGVCPEARIIDVTHAIPRQDVLTGALALARALPYLPVGVHVAVVDPGVGGERRAVALRLSDHRILVGPDNGLLWPAVKVGGGVEQAIEISDSRWRLEPVSATFHGRDVFAPVAAALAAGHPFADAGAALDRSLLVRLELPPARLVSGEIEAVVASIDRFGNVALTAGRDHLEGLGVVNGGSVELAAPAGWTPPVVLADSFVGVGLGELVMYVDSSGGLAVAVNCGSAAERLGVRVGDELRVRRAP